MLALLLAIGALTALETTWRAQGYRPSITDDMDLWCVAREQLANDGSHAVALLGGSRIQLGLDPIAFENACPGYRVYSLAVDGRRPVAVLEDLADDEQFQGVIIFSLLPEDFGPKTWQSQRAHVRYYHSEWNAIKRVARNARTALQKQFVCTLPELQVQRILPGILSGDGVFPQWLITRPDRYKAATYANRTDMEDVIRERAAMTLASLDEKRVTADEWAAGRIHIQAIVDRIQARGGKVVFVRFPVSGEVKTLEASYYPRTEYWDVFANETSAITIHFADLQGEDEFDCPDGSHLSAEDSYRFTRALATQLAQRLPLISPPR